jgi:NADH-quinone oxidoreductase subunit L
MVPLPSYLNPLLPYLVFIPLAGFFLSFLVPARKEKWLSQLSVGVIGLQMFLGFPFTLVWLLSGHPSLNVKDLMIFQTPEYQFLIDFYFDKITATYFLVGSVLTSMVVVYSRYYLHRETGYKRFFNTILLFYLGYTLTIFSGNFETLFIGWEILGISSFLLIAFYQDRYLPVKNALKVFSVYRIGDIGLLLAMWMSHHLWLENISFAKLNNYVLVHFHLQNHTSTGLFISLMLLVAASAKSAQLPFSSWLPRAMEGPTPSSAIFYGSLSVHIGVFLLLRTYTFWEHQWTARIFIALVGLATALVATSISRVQSSIKSQVAYASIAQIGLIFIEIAAGFEKLALFHFAGNAFLRTYQLLVSPSVVSYLIREQFYHYAAHEKSWELAFPSKIRNTLYILSLKEWNLDSLMYRLLWTPLKWIARILPILHKKSLVWFFLPVLALGTTYCIFQLQLPDLIKQILPIVFACCGLLLVLKSFAERKNMVWAWTLILGNHGFTALSIASNTHLNWVELALYLSGIVFSGILGLTILTIMKRKEPGLDLSEFHGHQKKYPKMAFVFLLACLGMTGFPITPAFIGEDLLFTHIHENQLLLAATISLSFIVDGLSIIRVYARVFMGSGVYGPEGLPYRNA